MQLRWWTVILYSIAIFCSHYARDVTGALQVEMSKPPLNIDSVQYGKLNAAFFFPNILTPLVIGGLSQKLGVPQVLVGTAIVYAVGHFLFAFGVNRESYQMMANGRFLSGTGYEMIDVLPMTILCPFLTDHWDTLTAVCNVFLRLGSVVNFVVSPIVYSTHGIHAALGLASVVGMVVLPVVFVLTLVYKELERREKSEVFKQEAVVVELSGFSAGYWLFLLSVVFLYGSMVPFWFIASKFIREKWGYSLHAADALTMLPEGVITVVSPCLAFILDKSWNTRSRLIGVSIGLFGTMGMYLSLVFSNISPFLQVLLLGVCYGISNQLWWTCVGRVSPPKLLSLSAGFVGCASNLLPGVLPAILSKYDEPTALIILAGVAGLGGALALASAYAPHQVSPTDRRNDDDKTGLLEQPP